MSKMREQKHVDGISSTNAVSVVFVFHKRVESGMVIE